jgi:nicotinate-nucleotide pyrophosphorylase (carboxylating)
MIQTQLEEMQTQVWPIIGRALAEDIGDGDVTTQCIVPPETWLTGQFIAKEGGVIAGLAVVRWTLAQLDERVELTGWVNDGDVVAAGQVVATVQGPGQALLSGERVALNFLQRMSGIATLTHRFVEAVAGTSAIILDTRKTVPGLRPLDKWAVRLGGGQNHRSGLYDMVLIKENHVAAAGGITQAVARVRANDSRQRAIEVEVRNLAELQEALALNVDRILLDNMSLDELRQAVRLAEGQVPLEASGNVSLAAVAAIAQTGVDYISSGALTHSVRALDISLLLDLSPVATN